MKNPRKIIIKCEKQKMEKHKEDKCITIMFI